MNLEKMNTWLELARKCSQDSFWDGIGEEGENGNAKGKAGPDKTRSWSPPVNIYRAELQVWVWVELPGVRREDLDLACTGQTLRIKGIKADRMLIKDIPVQECYFGPFERTVDLPFPVDWSTATAKLSEGILLIRFTVQPVSEARIPVE